LDLDVNPDFFTGYCRRTLKTYFIPNRAKEFHMSSKKGIIALMGSGELTATMVEVHKELLAGLADPPNPIFLDTPAGFQLNVDQLSQRAVEYFRTQVQQPMSVASFKSNQPTTPYEVEKVFQKLRQGNFFLIGPGSPTYAVRQWQHTPIPEILVQRVKEGGCLVAASAAALTVGHFTLPVYEIYKVGEDLHWVEGINILEHFGFDLVVIPHWNNAEGGTHDTRFCYMGEPRFRQLESTLPEDISILGLDEHTACLINLEKEEALIKGIGTVTLRRQGAEMIFEKGDRLSLEVLRGGEVGREWKRINQELTPSALAPDSKERYFWDKVHVIEDAFRAGLESQEPKQTINALLELDKTIWKAQQDLESDEFISQARDILRELIVSQGLILESSPTNKVDCLAPLVEELLMLREEFRKRKQWKEADAVRDSLQRSGIVVEDTEDGPQWRLKS
jgi:peptidase E